MSCSCAREFDVRARRGGCRARLESIAAEKKQIALGMLTPESAAQWCGPTRAR
jgi:hypothetical protein